MSQATATRSGQSSIASGVRDLAAGLRRWPVWWSLSLAQTRGQYRRTYLGPWWMTVQMAVFVAGLSLLFGVLLGQDLRTFVPYVAVGYLGFTWMTSMITAGSTCFIANGSAITTSAGPLSVYALGAAASPTIQFAHDAVAVAVALILFEVPLGASLVLVVPALLILAANGVAVSLWLGPLATRFRDVPPIVSAVVRVLFFFTPVFWLPTDLTRGQLAALSGWNPLAYLLEFFRAPLLGTWPSTLAVIGTFLVTLVNITLALLVFGRSRARLAYWL